MPDLLSPYLLLVKDLKSMVTELSDLDLQSVPESTSFLELGLDSLFLTQLTQAIRARYGVKLSFRQIMGEFSNFSSLAAHLAAAAPAEKLPAPTATSTPERQSIRNGCGYQSFERPLECPSSDWAGIDRAPTRRSGRDLCPADSSHERAP